MGCYCNKPKRRWPFFVMLAVLAAVVLLVWLSDANGQTAPDSGATAVTNQTCPVLTDEAIDPEQWIEYEGERVYFCCRKCKRMFEREPQAYLANLPRFAGTTAVSDAPSVNHDHAADSHDEHPGGEEHNHAEAPGGHEPQSDGHDHAAHDHAVASHTEHAGGDEHNHAETTGGNDPHEISHDDAAHDHAAHDHGDEQTGLTRLIGWLGYFHPPATDFPIALLMSAAIAELLLMATGRPLFESAARFCVWLGSASAVGAVVLGWFFAGFHLTDGDWVMTLHRWLGTSAGVWALLLLVLCSAAHRSDARGRQWQPWYRMALFIGAAAVAANGFFGGAMVYGLDHYAW